MTEEPRDAIRREAKIIAAASAISIDYRSIVENALSGLVHNTQVERRSVYMRARSTVRVFSAKTARLSWMLAASLLSAWGEGAPTLLNSLAISGLVNFF